MYLWLVALHLVGLVVFLLAHGVSIWVSFRVRGERNRDVIAALLGLSLRASQVLYLGLLLLGIGGLGAAFTAGWLATPWNLASYVVVVAVLAAMYSIALPYCHGLRAGLDRAAGAPALDDEALVVRLQSLRPEALAVVGGSGLVILVLLMVLRPGWSRPGRRPVETVLGSPS